MSTAEYVRFDDVSLRVGTSLLLQDVSMNVRQGETMVLLGRSGSGKTTTLKLVNRLLEATSGRVYVDGMNVADWNPIALRRRTGYVIQETGLFPHFTIARNVGLVPELEKWPESKSIARVEEVLKLVGLEPSTFMSRYPHQLSGGQRQRAGVARSLAGDPPLLLMDEPFGALDPLTRSEIQTEFRNLRKRLNKTILFVTHDIAEAFILGDRIAFLEKGKFVALGTPQELMRSKDPVVESFLGPARQQWNLFKTLE